MRCFFPTFVCIFSLICLANLAWADTSVSISESQQLTFPTIGLPVVGTRNITISALNSSTSGTGTIISGTASRGMYPLTSSGEGGLSISIDISGIDSGNSGITLSNFHGFYNGQSISSFPSPTLPIPATSPSNTPLYIGAKVTATPAVAPGSYAGSFTITVFVQ